jgi:hypothetical protein
MVRKRFEETLKKEDEGTVGNGEDEKEEKASGEEQQREGDIQDLLDRPRIMSSGDKMMTSPVEVDDNSTLSRSSSGHHLTRRKASVDVPREEVEMRGSIDISEVLGPKR